MKTYHKHRIALLTAELKSRRLDAFLVSNETNVSYLSGFRSQDSTLLITLDKRFFLADSRYVEDAGNTVKDFEVVLVKGSTYAALKELIKKNGLKRIGFESMNLPYEIATRLKDFVGKAVLVPIKDLVELCRAVKDEAEIELIKKSIRLTRTVMDKAVKEVEPGVPEEAIGKKIELEFIKSGGRPSFEPIVAAGPNSSKPHAVPSAALIENNSFVMIDMGCKLNGYNSDLTRMVVLGRVSEKFKKIYNIVSAAQNKAIEIVASGIRLAEADKAARGYIQSKGFGKYFGHSLGHGVGMDVHEEPSVSSRSQGVLKAGMVITIEPAIYIPNFGGVRIEDMVLVTEKGCEILSR